MRSLGLLLCLSVLGCGSPAEVIDLTELGAGMPGDMPMPQRPTLYAGNYDFAPIVVSAGGLTRCFNPPPFRPAFYRVTELEPGETYFVSVSGRADTTFVCCTGGVMQYFVYYNAERDRLALTNDVQLSEYPSH